jgi:hypothetical protein
MRIREDLLQRARSQSVISYLQHLGIKGRYSNGRWVCCSPLRKESEASFSVSPEKNLWHDFGLGVGGDLISLVEKLNGFDFKTTISHLAEVDLDDDKYHHVRPPKPSAKETATHVPPDNGQAQTGRKTVEKYFKSMGLPFYAEIAAFPLSYKGSNYIGFPVEDPTTRLGVECRGFAATERGITPVQRRMTLGKKLPWSFKRDPERVLITESITDALAGEVILGDTSLSLLALNGVANVKLLPLYVNSRNVLLAMDNDGPENGYIGQQMQSEAERILLDRGCRVSHVTSHIIAGVKDLYRLLQKETAQTK